jgi:hypothetical protein
MNNEERIAQLNDLALLIRAREDELLELKKDYWKLKLSIPEEGHPFREYEGDEANRKANFQRFMDFMNSDRH